jgi:hypothetical protein
MAINLRLLKVDDHDNFCHKYFAIWHATIQPHVQILGRWKQMVKISVFIIRFYLLKIQ